MRVAFYKAWCGSGKKLDKLISIWTWGPFSHCELIFSDGTSFSSSSRDGGVRYKKIHYVPDHWEILDIDINPNQEKDLRSWCDGEVGKSYDYLGVLMYVPRKTDVQNKKKWYCSEICSTVLEFAGLYEGKTTISPNTFYKEVAKWNTQ